MFEIEEYGREKVMARFDTMPDRVHRALLQFVHVTVLTLKAHIVRDKLHGQVLNLRTGKLAGSIQSDVKDSTNEIVGSVYSSTTATPYNRAHEYGATIPDRVPKKAKVLHWMSGGKHVFAMRARGFVLPERSYLRSGLKDMKTQIIEGMKKTAVMEASK